MSLEFLKTLNSIFYFYS